MRIRRFETVDVAKVLQLANTYALFDGPMHESDFAIAKYFPEGFLVAESGEHIVGFIMSYLREIPQDVLDTWGVSTVGHIEMLVVNPLYRRKGVGTALIEQSLRVLEQAGAGLVTLHCPATAEDAKHIYDKLGFEVRAYEMKKII